MLVITICYKSKGIAKQSMVEIMDMSINFIEIHISSTNNLF